MHHDLYSKRPGVELKRDSLIGLILPTEIRVVVVYGLNPKGLIGMMDRLYEPVQLMGVSSMMTYGEIEIIINMAYLADSGQ